VGRWESYQKNFHGLCRIVVAFLRSHPDWRAEFVGSGLGSRRAPKGVRFFSSCSAQALARKMQSSRILVYASFYESFLLAGAEALCCGARVVGPSGLVTTRFFEFLSGPYDQRTPKKCISLAEKLENAAGRKPLSPATVRLVRRKLNPTRIAKRLIAFGGGRSLRNTQAAPTKKKP
jgi:glycosyltransferase involved in cell wall biosynthesis